LLKIHFFQDNLSNAVFIWYIWLDNTNMKK
jgi:hypothetical protein